MKHHKKPDFSLRRDKVVEVDEGFDVLKEAKKKDIIKAYNEELGINENILNFIWTCCERLDENTIKKIRKGTYKAKYKIERTQYKDGDILKTVEIENPNNEENHPQKKIKILE